MSNAEDLRYNKTLFTLLGGNAKEGSLLGKQLKVSHRIKYSPQDPGIYPKDLKVHKRGMLAYS